MTASAQRLAAQLRSRTDTLGTAVRSGIRANSASKLNKQGLSAIHEAAFLSIARSFEVFLEELFFVAVSEPPGKSGLVDVSPRINFDTRAEAEEYVLDNKDYLDWLPWAPVTTRRSERYLASGGPFGRLERAPQEKSFLKDHHTIRNAIAHESGTARTRFLKLPPVTKLPPSQQTPSGLLQSVDKNNNAFWVRHTQNLLNVSRVLSAPDMATARAYILVEDPYRVGERPGDCGPFRCRKCGNTRKLTRATAAMPGCQVCSAGADSLWDRV